MAGHSRYSSSHAGSSAFSASANANEDWTKISDLAERRRIQNRIAQRNYRKKLKKRLEDLERRAGSSSASPEQQHSEIAGAAAVGTVATTVSSSPSASSTNSKPRQTSTQAANRVIESQDVPQLSPELLPLDDHPLFDSPSSRRLPSPSRNGLFYSTYPPPLGHPQHEYQQPTSYNQPDQQNYFYTYQHPTDYSQSLPPTLPTMLPSTYTGKTEPVLFGDEDTLNPFSMTYANLAGLEVPTNQSHDSYGDSCPHSHTPLSDQFSLDRSPYHSPNQLHLPPTPESRSASPGLARLHHVQCN